jgi:hypothetical protein
MGLFSNIFTKILKEDNMAGLGGVFGNGPSVGAIFSPPDMISSGDRYAPGDARMPFALGSKKRKSKKTKIKIQRRPIS